MTVFKYLGKEFTAVDGDWLAVVGTLGKARKIWGRLSRIFSPEGADPKVSGFFLSGVAGCVDVRGGDVGAYP